MAFLIDKAFLQYEIEAPGVLNLWHTEVPLEFRGHGIGKLLAKVRISSILKN